MRCISKNGVTTVGRESELERLDATLDGLGKRGAACVSVEGEPGIGKTHVLQALRAYAEERGFLVLSGSATEFERDLPFSVWADALDAYVASQELELDERWSGDFMDELAQIIPSVRPRDGRARGSVADERYRAHRAVRRLLELLASDQPLVVVLDDLHWGDEASIELLAALLRREPEAPVLFAVAFRPGQAPGALSAALAVVSVERIVLEPLTEAQASILLGGLEPRAAAAIYRHGGGNPFYLEQLKRARHEGRLPATIDSANAEVDVAGVPVPAAVVASLVEELGALPADELTLLRAAAVAGEPFEPDLAAVIAELPRADGLQALDQLLVLDLVRPTPVPRQFVFRHPLVRRAVYESAPAGWRLAAHARAADALAATRRRRRRACAPRRAVRRPGRRGGDLAPARGGSRRSRPGTGGGGALVRSDALPPAGHGRAPGGCARLPRVVAPLPRRARSLRHDAAGRDRAAAAGRRLAEGRT